MPIFRVKSVKIYTGQKKLHGYIRGIRDKLEVWTMSPIELSWTAKNITFCLVYSDAHNLEVYFIKNKMVELSNLGQRLLICRQSRVIVVDGLQLIFRVAPAGDGGLVGGQR